MGAIASSSKTAAGSSVNPVLCAIIHAEVYAEVPFAAGVSFVAEAFLEALPAEGAEATCDAIFIDLGPVLLWLLDGAFKDLVDGGFFAVFEPVLDGGLPWVGVKTFLLLFGGFAGYESGVEPPGVTACGSGGLLLPRADRDREGAIGRRYSVRSGRARSGGRRFRP